MKVDLLTNFPVYGSSYGSLGEVKLIPVFPAAVPTTLLTEWVTSTVKVPTTDTTTGITAAMSPTPRASCASLTSMKVSYRTSKTVCSVPFSRHIAGERMELCSFDVQSTTL